MTPGAHTVTIATYNTIHLEEGSVYTLKTPFAGPYYYNVMNLGPCAVYIRYDADPVVGHEQCEMLPPYACDNLIVVPEGTQGLRFLAGPPCFAQDPETPPETTSHSAVIIVRLVRG